MEEMTEFERHVLVNETIAAWFEGPPHTLSYLMAIIRQDEEASEMFVRELGGDKESECCPVSTL